jgi:hypothetical protein
MAKRALKARVLQRRACSLGKISRIGGHECPDSEIRFISI